MASAQLSPSGKLEITLAPLLPRLELDAACQALVAGIDLAAGGIAALERGGKLIEACRLAAHALPKREAVWWCCMCARAVPDPTATPADAAALEAAERWVRRPEEEARRAAMAAAEAAAYRTTEAWAAVGAFWSGGSMSPVGQPVVPPGEHLTGVAVSGAVVLAAVRPPTARFDARLQRFLGAAREIAAGGPGRLEPEAP
jgi:hypothetical protein